MKIAMATHKRVLSFLLSLAVLLSMLAWASSKNLLSASAEELYNDEHTDVLHVWAEVDRDPLSGKTPTGALFTAWTIEIPDYTFAAGDKLVYDLYTDSDGSPDAIEEYPSAGVCNDADWGYFGEGSYVHGFSKADGSAFRTWKHMEVPIKDESFNKCSLLAGIPSDQGEITRSDAYFDNVRILDVNGEVKYTVFESDAAFSFRYCNAPVQTSRQGARIETAEEAARPETDYLRVSLTGKGKYAWAYAYLPVEEGVTFGEGDYLDYDVYFESRFWEVGGMEIWNLNGVNQDGNPCGVMAGGDNIVGKVNSTWPMDDPNSQMVTVSDSSICSEMHEYWRNVKIPVNLGHVYTTDCKVDFLRIGGLIDDGATITMRLRNIVLKNKDGEIKHSFYNGEAYSSRYDEKDSGNNSNVAYPPYHLAAYEISAYRADGTPIVPLDPAPALELVDRIEALPNAEDLVLEDEAELIAIREAYNKLTVAQKELVTNLSKLAELEARMDLLKNPVVYTPSESYIEFRAKFTPDPDGTLDFAAKYALFGLEKPERDVRLEQGDRLIYETYLDTKTAGIGFLDVAATDGTKAHALGLNGGIQSTSDGFTELRSDFTSQAYLKWYERSLTMGPAFEGKTLDTVFVSAQQGADFQEGPYMAARYRNIRIVGSNGEVKYVFDCDRYYYDDEGRYGSHNQNNKTEKVPSVEKLVISSWDKDDERIENPDGDTEEVTLLSSAADAVVSIDGTYASVGGDTYTVRLPKGTDVTALTPDFTLAKGAAVDKTGPQDFTDPVTYTITSEDGTVKKTLQVKVLLVDESGTDDGEPYLELRVKFTEDPGLALGFGNKYGLISLEPPTGEIVLEEGDILSYDVMLQTYTRGIGYLGIQTDVTRTHLSQGVYYSDWRRGLGIDLMEDAYMKWFNRSLTIGADMAGQKVKSLEVGVNISPESEEAEYLSAAFRNIKLTDSEGNVKYVFDCGRYYFDDSHKYGSYIERNVTQEVESIDEVVLSTYYSNGSRILNPDGASQEVTLLSPETVIAGVAIDGVEGFGSFGNFTVVLPAGTDRSNLTPSFVLPTGATIDKTGPQDFTQGPVTYTVTAEDGVSKGSYTLAVEEEYSGGYDPGSGADPGNEQVPPSSEEEIPPTGEDSRLPAVLLFVGAMAVAVTAMADKTKRAISR